MDDVGTALSDFSKADYGKHFTSFFPEVSVSVTLVDHGQESGEVDRDAY